jgi:hypothetical protein
MHLLFALTIKTCTISVLVGHEFSFGLYRAMGFTEKDDGHEVLRPPSGFFLEVFDVLERQSRNESEKPDPNTVDPIHDNSNR